MRFLTVSLGYHPDVIGGAWRVAAAQCAGLAARGHPVEVITAQASPDLPGTELREGVRIHRFPQGNAGFYVNWRAENRAAAALIRERLDTSTQPTLIIQHHAFLEPAVATAPSPVLHVFHGPWSEEYRSNARAKPGALPRRLLDPLIQRMLHRVERRALRRAGRILVLSRHFASRLPL